MQDRARQAVDFIVSHCPNVGAFYGSGDPFGFLQESAERMRTATPSVVFPSRYIEHVAYAVHTAGRYPFLSPPAAVAAVYLATRFEFYFRLLSAKLNSDGTWVSSSGQEAAFASIGNQRLKEQRVSNVSLAYEVMKLGTSSVVPHFARLDAALYPSPITAGGDFTIAHVGARIAYGRHRVAHGQWGDISAEAVFYGLATAVVFYGAEGVTPDRNAQ